MENNKDIDLTPILRNRMKSFPRKRGRYNSSELYGITHGYVTPSSWISPPDPTVEGLLRMWNGALVHDYVQKLLDTERNEVKKEYNRDGITLVAKVDHLPDQAKDDSIWEIKSSENAMESAKPSHEYQGKLYCTIFERPTTKILQPVQNQNGLYLKILDVVNRDDVWFEIEWQKLLQFHYQVEEIFKNQSS